MHLTADTGEGSLSPLIFHREGIDVKHLVYSFRQVEVLQCPKCCLTLQQQVTGNAPSALAFKLNPCRGGLFRYQSLEEIQTAVVCLVVTLRVGSREQTEGIHPANSSAADVA